MLRDYNYQAKSTLECILKYLSNQIPLDLSKLKINPLKTKEQFLNNYTLHDIATAYIALKYFQKNFSLHPIGKDLRNESVMIINEVPDYYVEKIIDIDSEEHFNFFCFDVKAKRKINFFGWVNERAIHGYKKLSDNCNVPVYLIFILFENGRPTETYGYCNLSKKPLEAKIAWDKNKVLVYDWKKGLPNIKPNYVKKEVK